MLSAITDYAGRTMTLAHSGGELTSLTMWDPDGTGPAQPQQILFAYQNHRMVEQHLGTGLVYAYQYDDWYRLAAIVNPDRSVRRFKSPESYGFGSSNPQAPAEAVLASGALGQ